jgi:hypothetical protein
MSKTPSQIDLFPMVVRCVSPGSRLLPHPIGAEIPTRRRVHGIGDATLRCRRSVGFFPGGPCDVPSHAPEDQPVEQIKQVPVEPSPDGHRPEECCLNQLGTDDVTGRRGAKFQLNFAGNLHLGAEQQALSRAQVLDASENRWSHRRGWYCLRRSPTSPIRRSIRPRTIQRQLRHEPTADVPSRPGHKD